ncbi:uncharacterized protein RHO17_016835 [Thomomys bottae]
MVCVPNPRPRHPNLHPRAPPPHGHPLGAIFPHGAPTDRPCPVARAGAGPRRGDLGVSVMAAEGTAAEFFLGSLLQSGRMRWRQSPPPPRAHINPTQPAPSADGGRRHRARLASAGHGRGSSRHPAPAGQARLVCRSDVAARPPRPGPAPEARLPPPAAHLGMRTPPRTPGPGRARTKRTLSIPDLNQCPSEGALVPRPAALVPVSVCSVRVLTC